MRTPGQPGADRGRVGSAGRRRSLQVAGRCAIVAMLGSIVPAFGQGDGVNAGRWWWYVTAGVEAANVANGGEVRSIGGDVTFGVNGYVVHPSIASFHAYVSEFRERSDNGTTQTLSTDNYGVEIRGLQTGAYPFYLSYGTGRNAVERDGLVLPAGRVRGTESFAGRLAFRRGGLRGMSFGVSDATVDYDRRPTDERTRYSYSWNRSLFGARHFMSLEHRDQVYGGAGSESQDTVLNVRETKKLVSGWHWSFTGLGLRRDYVDAVGTSIRSDSLRIEQAIRGAQVAGGTLSFRFRSAAARSLTPDWRVGHGIDGAYSRPIGRRWSIGAYGNYGIQDGVDRDVRAPSAGLQAGWTHSASDWRLGVNGQLGLARVEVETPGEMATNDSAQWSIGANYYRTLSNTGVSLQLTGRISRREFDLEREVLEEAPDLGVRFLHSGIGDRRLLRGSVNGGYEGRSWKLWSEWEQTESNDDRSPTAVSSFDRFGGGGTIGLGGISLDAGLGETTARLGSDDQGLRYATLRATWKMTRTVRLYSRYRYDDRSQPTILDTADHWVEFGASYTRGMMTIEARYWRDETRVEGRDPLSDRGVEVRARTTIAGWLPVVTGTARKGFIR